MKKLMCIAALALSLTASGRLCADPADWNVYTPKGEKFSISFPDAPTSESKTAPSPIGDINMTMYTSSADSTGYMLGVVDIPEDARPLLKKDPESALNGVAVGLVNGIAKGVKGKVISQKKVKAGDHSAVEIKATMFGGKGVLRCRALVTDDRMYLMMVMAPADKDVSIETTSFFGSFKVDEALTEK